MKNKHKKMKKPLIDIKVIDAAQQAVFVKMLKNIEVSTGVNLHLSKYEKLTKENMFNDIDSIKEQINYFCTKDNKKNCNINKIKNNKHDSKFLSSNIYNIELVKTNYKIAW